MSFSDKFGKLQSSFHRVMDRFLYEDEGAAEEAEQQMQPQPQLQQADPGAQQAAQFYAAQNRAFTAGQPYPPLGEAAAPAQPPVFQQEAYRPAYSAQMPYQPQVPVYQSQAQTADTRYNAQFQPTQRNRRARREMEDENVVQFPAGAMQMPVQESVPGKDGEDPNDFGMSLRVMSARSIQDCRAAITLLRDGDIVLVTMDGVSDATEMRRYVDTLSGACFSLTATITKVNRYGSYLLAPQELGVFCDSVISQMNTPPRPRPAAPAQPAQQQAEAAAPRAAQPVQAAPGEREQPFYMRRPQQISSRPVFEQQPVANGYTPDLTDGAAL